MTFAFSHRGNISFSSRKPGREGEGSSRKLGGKAEFDRNKQNLTGISRIWQKSAEFGKNRQNLAESGRLAEFDRIGKNPARCVKA